jgi:predicted nucleic acid-binding protein
VKSIFVDTGAWIGLAVHIHALAMETFRKYSDQELSVVDCVAG